MQFSNVTISHYQYHLPDDIFTSESIESKLSPLYEKLKLPFGRLELMTGIRERRAWPIGTRPSTIASQAAQKIFDQETVNNPSIKDEIDCLILASVCRDFLEPATASVVHDNLKLNPNCEIFDLSNACLGVMNGILLAARMIEKKQWRRVLVVSGENAGPLLESTINRLLTDPSIDRKGIKKYIANLTIGSTATAVIISSKDLKSSTQKPINLDFATLKTDSSANVLCQGGGNTHELTMETDSEALLKAGCLLVQQNWIEFKKVSNWNEETPDFVIGHQVGTAHEKLVLESINLHQRPTFNTYPVLGNTGSSALPVTLMKLLEQTKIENKKIAMIGIGSGLSSIILGVSV